METRTLRIWDGEKDAHAAIYVGLYVDDDKNNSETMEAITWPARRVGFVFDTKKACIACFAQDITSFDDPCPTDIVIGPGVAGMFKVLAAWSIDPLKADPPSQQEPCQVWFFGKRNMTEKEKRVIANVRRGPQTEAVWQRYADEFINRLVEKLSPSLVSAFQLAATAKIETASAYADKTAAPPAPQYVFRREGESWEMVFEGGKVFHPQHRKGYEYIRELLAHPGHEYTAPELTGVVNKLLSANAAFQDGKDELAVTTGTHQFKMDKKAIAQTLTRLDELRAELNAPTNSEVENQEIKNEIEMLEAHFKSNTFLGRAKTFSAQDDKERARITQLIQEARKAIGKSLPKLETHLKAIKTGHRFVYTGSTPFVL